jgi:hypothetical protein
MHAVHAVVEVLNALGRLGRKELEGKGRLVALVSLCELFGDVHPGDLRRRPNECPRVKEIPV